MTDQARRTRLERPEAGGTYDAATREAFVRRSALRLTVAPAEAVTEVDVGALVEDAVAAASSSRVEIFAQCGGGTIAGDRATLSRLLSCLFEAAVAGTREGGGIFFASYVTGRGHHHFTIRDTGAPFEGARRFERARRRANALASARSEVARLGGLMRTEIDPRAGTAIAVWLPRDAHTVHPALRTAAR